MSTPCPGLAHQPGLLQGEPEVQGGERGLIEDGLAAHPQMSDTLVAYLGDQRWPKRRTAEALE